MHGFGEKLIAIIGKRIQNETMRLTAQVVDKFSAPIRDMQRSFRAMGEHGRAAHVEGARYAKAHTHAFQDLRKTAKEAADHFKNILQPTMVGLGLSAVSTAGAIAGLAKGIKDLGEFGREMSFLSKETGLSVNQLNAWVAAGERAGLTSYALAQQRH